MDDRKKALEEFKRRLQIGDHTSSDLISPANTLGGKAFQARNLAQEALANEVLKNTGIPIPDKRASRSKMEDFLDQLMKERYSELDPNVNIVDLSEQNANGAYFPGIKKIALDKGMVKEKGLLGTVGTMLHEAGHQYDDEVLGYKMPEELKANKVPQLDFENMYETAKKAPTELDATELYELAGKGHHAKIPKLRDANTFELGALKSYLKNGNFKSIAGPVAGLGLTAALMPEDASASDFIPGLDQAENAGSAFDDKLMQTEVRALQNYDASQARRDALARLRNGK
ncbi:MAG TPA: hypothetical protein VGD26_10420 [Chitinophagaceae bacterium]